MATDPLPWDGRRLASQLAATGPTRTWRSAYDEDLVVELPTTTPADLAGAVARARSAQVDWAARPLADRERVLLALHDAVLDHREDLADLLQYEGGKARLTAMEEILHLAMTARYYARVARQVLHDRRGRGMVPLLTRIDERDGPRGRAGGEGVDSIHHAPRGSAVLEGMEARDEGGRVRQGLTPPRAVAHDVRQPGKDLRPRTLDPVPRRRGVLLVQSVLGGVPRRVGGEEDYRPSGDREVHEHGREVGHEDIHRPEHRHDLGLEIG